MRTILLFSLLLLASHITYGQEVAMETKATKQGNMYAYWGWNKESFSKSDIHFSGADYDFKLIKAQANDRQSKFSLNTYFNPTTITIPQYNFRIGYFFKENWDVSLGVDHMKYVLEQDQEVEIYGFINNDQSIYTGTFEGDEISIVGDFLRFEHTDGLNYVNTELRYSYTIIDSKRVEIGLIGGLGAGLLIPRTNTTLMGKERYDEFHLSGYGAGGMLGINATFFNSFFIQSEFKQGFINLPNVRTSNSTIDRASHKFFFSQCNIVFGAIFKLKSKT